MQWLLDQSDTESFNKAKGVNSLWLGGLQLSHNYDIDCFFIAVYNEKIAYLINTFALSQDHIEHFPKNYAHKRFNILYDTLDGPS